MAVAGSAIAIDPQGRERPLVKGDDLHTGDKVVTTASSLVQIRLHDGGYMSVRPSTEVVIDQFIHDEKDASKSSFLLSLLRGGFRSITGLIGRANPNGYQIRTATATIGIRGTDHEPMVILDTPEMASQGAAGLYDKVNEGETFIRSSSGILTLKRGDVGFAPLSAETPPQVLLKIPQFYRVLLKTDARDAKDSPIGKTDDANRPGNAGDPLRPSVAARREAPPANPDGAAKPLPTSAPAGATPLLTPEAKRAILQTLAPITATAPTAPIAPTAPKPDLTAPPPPLLAPLRK